MGYQQQQQTNSPQLCQQPGWMPLTLGDTTLRVLNSGQNVTWRGRLRLLPHDWNNIGHPTPIHTWQMTLSTPDTPGGDIVVLSIWIEALHIVGAVRIYLGNALCTLLWTLMAHHYTMVVV